MRNNKLINFILEFTQIMLVFLGVFSALMCAAAGLDLTFDRGLCTIIMLVGSILFYGLFTVLETFHRGKLYGIIGITFFVMLIVVRFLSVVKKGFVTIINSFLKEFMNYSGANLSLLSYTDTESATVRFCTTLVLILLGVYLIAIVSAFFYRRRRSVVFIAATIPWVLVPLVVGRMGYFSNLFTYLIIAIAIVGTRHLRTDATDRRMRQKLSILLMIVGLLAGVVSYLVMPPERYERNESKITQTKNSIVALTSWSTQDVFTWFKSYFNDDAIDYGKIGKKKEVTYSGSTMLKISGDVNKNHGIYLKGYVGDTYENNRWSSLAKDDTYNSDFANLQQTGTTLESWHLQLRNTLGDSETSGANDLWKTGTLKIKNLAFGYGNYLVPYLPTTAFRYQNNGRSTVERLGIEYTAEYFMNYPNVMRKDFLNNNYSIANVQFWESTATQRQRLTNFAKKYYLQLPDSVSGVCEEFRNSLKTNGDLLNRYKEGSITETAIATTVKQYIMKDTTYTLAPGKTPSDKEAVEYFLKENKKGYCTYYATAAVILLRSAGIPARYVEGMYIPKSQLANCSSKQEVSIPDSDAHAWVEVYSEKYGFVPLEVTPGFGEDEADSSNVENDELSQQNSANQSNSSAGDSNKTEEVPEEVTPTPVVSQTPEESMTFDDIEGNEDKEESTDGSTLQETSTVSKVLSIVLKVVIGILLFIAIIEGQRRIRKKIFRRNLDSLKRRKRIRMVHHHLALMFFQKGVHYRGQSVAVYAHEIAAAMDMPEDEIHEYVSLVYHASFGPDNITEEEVAAFRIIYENVRRKAYEDAKIIKKLYYMYIMVL